MRVFKTTKLLSVMAIALIVCSSFSYPSMEGMNNCKTCWTQGDIWFGNETSTTVSSVSFWSGPNCDDLVAWSSISPNDGQGGGLLYTDDVYISVILPANHASGVIEVVRSNSVISSINVVSGVNSYSLSVTGADILVTYKL